MERYIKIDISFLYKSIVDVSRVVRRDLHQVVDIFAERKRVERMWDLIFLIE